MSTIVTRAGKGSALTWTEADANFTNLNNKVIEVVSVKDFGAVGDGVTDDTAAFVSATALGRPVFVPNTSSFYSITSLTSDQIKLLYGFGIVKLTGVLTQISTEPWIANDTAHVRVTNQNLQPSKWSSVDGSLFNGALSIRAKRTGGFGSYGLSLTEYVVSDSIPTGEFDSGMSTWITAQNLTGGAIFSTWFGANTPSAALAQTYTSGAVIGSEINAGNRWSDFGLLDDIGATRYTVGLQIVPDVLPAPDGTTVATYPGSFAQVISKSITGHKWWTGVLVSSNSIVAGGRVMNIIGGSTAPNAYGNLLKASGYFSDGLDFSGATFSNIAVRLGDSQLISWGGSTINGTNTTIGISTGLGTGVGGLYANAYGVAAFKWSYSGSAVQLGFYGTSAIGKPTVTGSKGGNAALTSLMTALANLGLVTDSTS